MYEFNARIRYSEVDSEETLTLIGLLNYFQDISTFHSEDCGIDTDYLRKRNLAWVLNAWQIDVLKYARLCQRVRVGTIPYKIKGFLGYRNYFMEDAESGERLAVANSVWTLMDMREGRPHRVTEEMAGAYGISEQLAMEYTERRLRFDGIGEKQEQIVVKSHHLDTNCHVNNGQYVQFAMDFLPRDFAMDRLRAEYKKSALLGDTIIPTVYRGRETIGVSLQTTEGAVYANVEFSRLGR